MGVSGNKETISITPITIECDLYEAVEISPNLGRFSGTDSGV